MTRTCGELLVHLLEAYGVDTVFGIPGVHTVELYRGLPQTRIRHITPRHEQGAGFMADGYARCSGKPGVCFIVTGPGMLNIATAMAQAAADSVPMLVISGVNHTRAIGSEEGQLHALRDQRQTIDTLCAFSKTVYTPEALPKILAEAFNTFRASRPRPVHIQLPQDVMIADASHVPIRVGALAQAPMVIDAALDEAVALLTAAEKIVICYGGGARWAGQKLATALSERLHAPTLLTSNAKGLLPPGHALSLGSNHTFAPVRELVKAADVVLAIGTEMGQTDYDWTLSHPFPQPDTLIRVDIDPAQLNRPYLAQLALAGDAATTMRSLLQRLPEKPGTHGARTAAAVRARLVANDLNTLPMGQAACLRLIRDTLPDGVIIGDSTQIIYTGSFSHESTQPCAWFNAATGFGTLGYALPAAMGAALASAQPVVAIIGDGGIQFTLPELMTAVDERIPLTIIIWHNRGYGEIRDYMRERDLPTIGVDIAAPDFEHVAVAFGLPYQRIESAQALRQALLDARTRKDAMLLEIDAAAAFIADLGKDYNFFS